MRLEEFSCARDFFEAVHSASRTLARSRLTLAKMRAREGVRAQSYAPVPRGGAGDKMAVTDARMDLQDEVGAREREFREMSALALEVIYGPKGERGGVSALCGSATADAMALRYVDAEDWAEVADNMHFSARHCQRLCEAGLDVCDNVGLSRMAGGIGRAT